jgi:hypothetical protein
VPAIATASPEKNLANYTFFYQGLGQASIPAYLGYAMFVKDYDAGDLAKLHLKSDMPNANGLYEMIGIFLFTKKAECADPNVVDEELRQKFWKERNEIAR